MKTTEQEIREAISAATPGPWFGQNGRYGKRSIIHSQDDTMICADIGLHDMDLLVHTPEWLQYLLDQNAAQDKKLEVALGSLSWIATFCPDSSARRSARNALKVIGGVEDEQ
ncbi:hypothetical protein [Gorillibacterium sp. CAU 1737]|uniref:hypothetical protein n=1 Tax=Gorillibacterium sp. CAU 1737 TaxID=3140362 RepID=UPI0032608227